MSTGKDDIASYAEALAAVGRASGRTARVEQGLSDMLALLDKSQETVRFFADTTVRDEGKRDALQSLLGPSVDAVLLYFLFILLEEKVLHKLPAIAQAFFEQCAGKAGEAAGELVSARPLPQEKISTLEREASRALGRKVRLRQRIDPGLLGGAMMRVGDVVFDATVDRQIEDIRRHLLLS